MRFVLIFMILSVGASMSAGPQQQHECMGTGHDLGAAVDINSLNNKPVSLYGKDPHMTKLVEKTQDLFNHAKDGGPPPLENYGPAGLYRSGKRFTDTKLKENHMDHIHVRFRS